MRLWPLSTPERPKQLLPLVGEETLLRATLRRVGDRSRFAPPIVVAGAEQAEAVAAEAQGIGTLIVEPAARNTAPAIALAALTALPGDLLLVLPSDHRIADDAAFLDAVDRGRDPALEGWLVTFGIRPDRPETGYGYISRGDGIAPGVHRARSFVEKPDRQTAERYLADGGYDWNGGIFLFEAAALLDGLERHAPAVLQAARDAIGKARRAEGRVDPDAGAFAAAPAASIDYALMERAERVAVVPVDMGWSDVGSWEALWTLGPRDGQENRLDGPVAAIDSQGCLIRSDGPRIAAIGVTDLVIVATPEAILVVPRRDSQRVREAVEALSKRK